MEIVIQAAIKLVAAIEIFADTFIYQIITVEVLAREIVQFPIKVFAREIVQILPEIFSRIWYLLWRCECVCGDVRFMPL